MCLPVGYSRQFDYTRFAEVEAQRKAEWEAGAAEREAAEREREAREDAFMASMRARIEEARLALAERAADRMDWSALENDEASESEGADVQGALQGESAAS